jgi:hypothetical protein
MSRTKKTLREHPIAASYIDEVLAKLKRSKSLPARLAAGGRHRAHHQERIVAELLKAAGGTPAALAKKAPAAPKGPTLGSHAGAGIDTGHGVSARRLDELFGDSPVES